MDKREFHNSTPHPHTIRQSFFNVSFLINQINIKASNMVGSAVTDNTNYFEIFYVIIALTIGLILSLTESLGLGFMKLRYIDA